MAKYSTYVELSPHYESVVDLTSESRNPNFWQEYIVHDDMRKAVEKICESLRHESDDARRSFWIHGTYGTGKTYAAIVLKHLFEDPVADIHPFLSKSPLLPYRDRFEALRAKDDYLVVWRSGSTGIKSGTQLMMEMESEIRAKLGSTFGGRAYYGRNSLIDVVQDKLKDASINWQVIFVDPAYGLDDTYGTFEELRSDVMDGDLEACETIAKICREKGWGLFNTISSFESWIKDIIAGNGLKDTGIVFIWDEFTGYLKDCGDDDVLRRLSELCKQNDAPFFLCIIVHRDPSWVNALGSETYARILHRYHELEFHISESAAYDLIGDSILTRAGMEDQWDQVRNQLMQSIRKHLSDFDNLDLGSKQDSLRRLCPIHPMTLSLLATVAQNFGASQRTLFRFMKDKSEAEQKVGFPHYIDHYGPSDWKWLTPDFLWDYFFTRESDIHDFTTEARRAFQHFDNNRDSVSSDETAMHIFKAAMLLVAVMSTEKVGQLLSQANVKRVGANRRTLYQCFRGQLEESDIDRYLEAFESNGILRLDRLPNGDARLELPYTGSADVFESRLEINKRKFTRNELFKKNGEFSKAIEEKMWDKTRATFLRMHIVACSSERNSLDNRLEEMKAELGRNPYRIGLLAVTISEASQYGSMVQRLKEISKQDLADRLVVCLLKEPLTNSLLEEWHRAITHKELALEDGKRGSSNQYDMEATVILEKWATSVTAGSLMAFYSGTEYALYGRDDAMHKIEADVIFRVFSAAPEIVVTQITAYRRAQESAAIAGIVLTADNSQIRNIADQIRGTDLWNAQSLDEIQRSNTSERSRAVASLAEFLHSKLSQGTRVSLDRLWLELQSPPFGYYDSMVCAYLLGFVMRFYVDKEFHWVDSDQNPFILNQENLATMIVRMCRNKVVNNTLSSGSEAWQKFRDYVRSIFHLSDRESANEEQARKYVRERIISAGVPFWVLKHVPDEKLGGAEAKQVVCRITDCMCAFIGQTGDQDDAMSDVITLFKGRGQIRQNILEAYDDASTRYSGFRDFIVRSNPQIQQYVSSIGLNSSDLFDAVRAIMQGAIYTWTEQQVIDRLDDLACEYQLIDTLNTVMGVQRKSARLLQKDLANCFDHMKVPGAVIECLDEPWIPALKALRTVAVDDWQSLAPEESRRQLDVLAKHGKTAWESTKSPRGLLREYMREKGLASVDDDELSSIYEGLSQWPYNVTEGPFFDAVEAQMRRLTYEQQKSRLCEQWVRLSGQPTVREWCKKFSTPIQWVLKPDVLPHIESVRMVQDNKRVDDSDLHNAVEFLQSSDLNRVLGDSSHVNDCFITQVGETYRDLFNQYKDQILLAVRFKMGNDVYSWANNPGQVRSIVKTFVDEKAREQFMGLAQAAIRSMPEADLRRRVAALLDARPELCELFVGEKR